MLHNFSRRFNNLQILDTIRLRKRCYINVTTPPLKSAKVKHVHHFSSSSRPRSPYAILNLKTSATEDDIKTAFRNMAKKYHPDLNPELSIEMSQNKMNEIITAYNQLMDKDMMGLNKAGDGRVALACEMFSLKELQEDRIHDVYTIRLMFEDYLVEDGPKESSKAEISSMEQSAELQLSNEPIIEIIAHPEDSVSDLKRSIQSIYEKDWGLLGRKKDRDQIRTGWELISLSNERKDENTVMSYHLFIQSYGICHGDKIYAVVRRYS